MSTLTEAKKAFETAKANLAFARMNKTEQRVTIAKDVIAAIKAKWLNAETGVYLELNDGDLEARKIEDCNVCALGSVFVCALKRDISIDLDGNVDSRNFMQEQLEPYFSADQLDLIETAFETDDYVKNDDWNPMYDEDRDRLKDSKNPTDRAIYFGSAYEDPSERLVAIMKNIIANNGVFKP